MTTLAAVALAATSCARVSVDPIKVEPIHIIMDVNIRVDRELDQFFAFENQTKPTSQPATMPSSARVDGGEL